MDRIDSWAMESSESPRKSSDQIGSGPVENGPVGIVPGQAVIGISYLVRKPEVAGLSS